MCTSSGWLVRKFLSMEASPAAAAATPTPELMLSSRESTLIRAPRSTSSVYEKEGVQSVYLYITSLLKYYTGSSYFYSCHINVGTLSTNALHQRCYFARLLMSQNNELYQTCADTARSEKLMKSLNTALSHTALMQTGESPPDFCTQYRTHADATGEQ